MSTLNDVFKESLTSAIKAAKTITDQYNQALAFAAIASAIAQTGLVRPTAELSEEASNLATTVPETATTTTKRTRRTKEQIAEEEAAKAAAATTKPEDDATTTTEPAGEAEDDEWTDAAMEAHAEEVAYVNDVLAEYDEAEVFSAITERTEGNINSRDDLRPSNIGYVATLIKEIMSAA